MEKISLHPDTINEVKEKIDLVEIVSDYVVLQKKGREFSGLCPFHDEKSPSFTVSPTKQLYYCFGCGAGGGAIKFLMDINKQSFKEVVLNLAHRYQIPVKSLAPEQQKEIQKQLSLREQLYEILAVACNFYQHSLRQKEGEEALKYLFEKRELSEETIQEFKLGYAPNNWETLYNYLVEIKNYPVMLVAQAGLIKKRNKGDGYIDYFRNRLMIPIMDKEGRVIAFGARSLDDSLPKYLNSPDTELFSKSRTLFALDKAKKTIVKEDKAIVVEGYFDAIALHRYNIKNAVAVLGTALTENHVKLLSRYTESKEIIVNFDADKAGLKATERAIKEVENLIYSGQMKLKVVNIPDGKDADEFLATGKEATEKYLTLMQNAPLWLDWQIQQIVNTRNLQESADFELGFQSIVRLLKKISKDSTKDYYLSSCAELLSRGRSKFNNPNSQEFKRIYQSLQTATKTYNQKKNSRNISSYLSKTSENIKIEEAEFLILLIYIHTPRYREPIIDLLDEKDLVFTYKPYRFLWQQIHNLNIQQLEQDTNNNLLLMLQENMNIPPEMSTILNPILYPTENISQRLFAPEANVQSAIASLESIKLEKYKQYCQQQIPQLEKDNDIQKIHHFYQEIITTEKQLQELKNMRFQTPEN
ncbi:DNA primase [Cyanobacterium stanieri LEGE 03274]|uniref:DNA primase n=1 Tax=Cyanobacterium stanieri LEGE 03274 TaxID=1828756 RepID=A0ABR9V1E7_9CHRO|nr:DNA primase [Cyanobacterium stanieri]MBE9221702.1 DNA primase [Cyanobacterium stanieri LEGE 03274]